MIIIHGMKTLPRLVGAALSERIRVMPAVVVTGARQTGKSTLVEHLIPGERRYATLDDLDVLDAARRDPEVLVGGPGPVTLDEVQREPDLLRAVKRAIDRDRTPGRFLLTGSANLLLMRHVSESLAGGAPRSSALEVEDQRADSDCRADCLRGHLWSAAGEGCRADGGVICGYVYPNRRPELRSGGGAVPGQADDADELAA